MNAASTLHVEPLDASSERGWRLYPRFEERSLLFAEKYLNFTNIQVQGLRQDLRNRWVTPGGALYVAGLCGDVMIAHFNGWVNVDYGQPYLFIFQTEVDDGYDFSHVARGLFSEIDAYVTWANNIYAQSASSARINKVVMQTFRNDKAFVRYLQMHGVSAVHERAVLGWYV